MRPGRGSREALERALREAIRGGRLKAGTALPSTRVLADDLGVARSTVSEAYAQLTAAGYLVTRQGADTRVASGPARTQRDQSERRPSPTPRFDLRPGIPDLTSFPKKSWHRALGRALAKAGSDVFASGDSRGRLELRTALAEYLARTRGVVAAPRRLLICNGFTQGLRLICDVLRTRGAGRVGIEDPSLPRFSAILRAAGLEPVPIPVDHEGLTTAYLDELDLDAVLVMPARQFPLGATMGSRRRAELLRWATRNEAVVIENDYEGEFRYERRPIGAMQAMDPDRVVYGGTTARSLAPGLRLGWLVLPQSMVATAVEIRNIADRYAGVLDQLAFAELIESGHFDRHVRAMRREYQYRRDLLVSAASRAAPCLRLSGIEAGLHALIELPAELDERKMLLLADRRSIGLHGLERYRHGSYAGPQALVVGFGTPEPRQFGACVRALASFLSQDWQKSDALQPAAVEGARVRC